MKFNNLAISWSIKKEAEQLVSSNYLICESENKAYLPLTLVEDLQDKIDILHLLRTPQHVPKDPMELVRFIKKLKGVLNEF